MNKKFIYLFLFLFIVPFLGFSQSVFINEINHMDVGDKGVEIAGPANTDLTGWTLTIYDPGGLLVNTIPLSSTIPDLQNTYGLIWIDVVMGMHETNGGVGLIDDNGLVVQFLSYGGQITGVGGILAGLTSESIGQQHTSYESLQLFGNGNTYPDFSWNTPGTFTKGNVNTNQTFSNNANNSGVLPVELMFFEGKITDDKAVLSWATATEKENDYFRVEHAVDGKEFNEIGQISGQGFSSKTIEYDFLHKNIITGFNYYRLVQVDFDGSESYSDVITLQKERAAPIVHVYPNPTSDWLVIQLPEAAKNDAAIRLFDSLGKCVLHPMINNSNDLNLDVSTLPKGSYMLHMNYLDTTFNQLIIIK